jgi:hypothetical protein
MPGGEGEDPVAGGGVGQVFGDGVVGGFPAVELDGAVEALHVVGAVDGGAVEEAGAGELE